MHPYIKFQEFLKLPERKSLLALLLLWGCLIALVVLGHDGWRIGQMLWLAMPGVLWYSWPVRSLSWHRMRTIALTAWAVIFVADAMTRAYLLQAYGAAPDSALVLGAVANSNPREQAEYFSSNWRSIGLWSMTLILFSVVAWKLADQGRRSKGVRPKWTTIAICGLLIIGGIAYASKPWRRLHPVVFWTHWITSAGELRAGWNDQQKMRDDALARAVATAPIITATKPSTVVWVISDSVNRDNMSLYGYGRATTPALQAQKDQVGNQMVVLRNAWSTEASTLPALRSMFNFGVPDQEGSQHVLAMARAAGYKIWWMSNHDDIAVEQQHARFANVVEMVNRTPGRSGTSLDGELLDHLKIALEDPTERKLIVVHLLGAHPHYSLRFPAQSNPFDKATDNVERQLIESGKSSWIRQSRKEYDGAIRYHDTVVAQTLQLTRTIRSSTEDRAWMYLSDHGQEVGHVSNRAGHSPMTESGYRIPALVWRNRQQDIKIGLDERPFRSDWVGWTMVDLLKIDWDGRSEARNVLDPSYVWQPPTLQFPIKSFFK